MSAKTSRSRCSALFGKCGIMSPSIEHQPENKMRKTKLDKQLEAIALEHMFVETLETKNCNADFINEISVWSVKSALEAAYELGKKAALSEAKK
ncbi:MULTISPECIES: hypothetical protein [unclassified Neisseria]|uniref:DUF6900 domain-containing protein n=1 Tax=unclassified Neisseria TaxID=2623750 RepID=UPI001D16BEEB|nr:MULTISPECIES: hypothetical protein [unclassified Neisseria]